ARRPALTGGDDLIEGERAGVHADDLALRIRGRRGQGDVEPAVHDHGVLDTAAALGARDLADDRERMRTEDGDEDPPPALAIVGGDQRVGRRVIRHLVDATSPARADALDLARVEIDDFERAVTVTAGDLVRTDDRHPIRTTHAGWPHPDKRA